MASLMIHRASVRVVRRRWLEFVRGYVNEWSRTNPDLQLPDGRKWVEDIHRKKYDSLLDYPYQEAVESRDLLDLKSLEESEEPEETHAPQADVEGIPLDVFHDLRGASKKKDAYYPFAIYDLQAPVHTSQKTEAARLRSAGHRDRIRKITDLLSHLSKSSRMKDILQELSFEGQDFEDVIYELEQQGRRDIALCALHFRPDTEDTSITHLFCDDFMSLLVRKKCEIHYLLQFMQIFEKCEWTAGLPLMYHFARLCIEQKELGLAMKLVKSKEASITDTALFNRFIESSISTNRADQAFQLYEEMKKRSVPPDIYTFASLMTSCFRRFDNQKLFGLFSAMKEQKVKPDLYAYNLCFRSCEHLNDLETALVLYQEMTETDKVLPNVKSYGLLIQLCGRNGKLDRALEIFEDLKNAKQRPNTLIMNGLLQGCLKSGKPEMANPLFRKLADEEGILADGYTFSILFRTCSLMKNLSLTLTLLRQMRQIGIRMDEVSYTAAIDVCAACCDAQTAMALLREMQNDGVRPNNVTRDALIRTCAQTAMQSWSFDLLEDVKRFGFVLDVKMYNAIMKSCSYRGDLEKAMKWRRQMVADGIHSDAETYAILISTAAKDQNLHFARHFFEEWKQSGLQPSILPYHALLQAYSQCRAYEKGMKLFQDMQSKAEKKIQPDVHTYNLIFELLMKTGRVQEANSLFDEMGERGITPNPRSYRLLGSSDAL